MAAAALAAIVGSEAEGEISGIAGGPPAVTAPAAMVASDADGGTSWGIGGGPLGIGGGPLGIGGGPLPVAPPAAMVASEAAGASCRAPVAGLSSATPQYRGHAARAGSRSRRIARISAQANTSRIAASAIVIGMTYQ